MSERDLDDLCRSLKRVPLDQLHDMANEMFNFFPRMSRLTRDEVLAKIKNALMKVSDRSARLQLVVRMYCYLIGKSVLCPWQVYCLGNPAARMEDFLNFHYRLQSAMQFRALHDADEKTLHDGVFRSALCITGPEKYSQHHEVVCLWARPEWPCRQSMSMNGDVVPLHFTIFQPICMSDYALRLDRALINVGYKLEVFGGEYHQPSICEVEIG
ncbi:hypothetical protein HPB50_026669 [Hyalomma asiaticum]|uniref:Uncharacterized protein n=1 Tax=Hyalomma asiaticum TaxID=266040 RepID=A0ACB7RU89_HYAAI|nr:hypothetical protein HPB50_026669 [Hyalomma asiaticum]